MFGSSLDHSRHFLEKELEDLRKEMEELRKQREDDRASIVRWLRPEAKAKHERAAGYEDAAMQNYYNTYEAALLDAAFVVEQRLDLRKHHGEEG